MSLSPLTYLHNSTLIQRYFSLTPIQLNQLDQLGELYAVWNPKINLISRKDIQHLYLRHILHSLSIAKIIKFLPKANILDLGTGGGLPGLPLAICFPHTHFTLIDGTGKKIKVVKAIIEALKLENVTAKHIRAENLQHTYDFIVSRAVAPLHKIYQWTKDKIKPLHKHSLPNGLLYLKGTPLDSEFTSLPPSYKLYDLHTLFKEPFFCNKKLVHLFDYPLTK